MADIVDWQTGVNRLATQLHPSLWTVVIPAAGRGTRLGFDKPKVLFPVGGVTILERLVRLFEPLCSQLVLVCSPDGAPLVAPELQRLLPGRGRIAIQPAPTGMADAVAHGLAEVRTQNTIVVWGDQFALKPASLEFAMRLLEGDPKLLAVCPTLLRPNPYIHFERDPAQVIVRVLQKREGDTLPELGESDAGVFFFSAEPLRLYLAELLLNPAAMGAATKEINFLPIFSLMDSQQGQLLTARIMTEVESVGINSRKDAEYLEAQAGL
jgi:bifunctional N-acetylglucosamine-1-phosphate-uridyltransferase/glucosamine-1-phosphate-acetyltransferase GlmU-like protein